MTWLMPSWPMRKLFRSKRVVACGVGLESRPSRATVNGGASSWKWGRCVEGREAPSSALRAASPPGVEKGRMQAGVWPGGGFCLAVSSGGLATREHGMGDPGVGILRCGEVGAIRVTRLTLRFAGATRRLFGGSVEVRVTRWGAGRSRGCRAGCHIGESGPETVQSG